MKNYLIVLGLSIFMILQSCATTNASKNENTFWVAGYKTEASNGAGKTMTLLVNRNEDYNVGKWENFYAPIQGFNFEKGVMKQITVTEKHLNSSQVPADASSIQYSLKEEVTAITDLRANLDGSWIAVSIDGNPINRMVAVPTLNIDISKKRYSGNDGCNNYSGALKNITSTEIELNTMASTKRACLGKNIETEYKKALENSTKYRFANEQLQLLDNNGNKTITFLKK